MTVPTLPTVGEIPTQPWNGVIFPPSGSNLPLSQAMTPKIARALPAVGRALGIFGGMAKQMTLDQYRGVTPLARSAFLDQPDPDRPRSWFVECQIIDYLLHGNAIHYVTSTDAAGYPLTAAYLPAEWVTLERVPETINGRQTSRLVYRLRGSTEELDADRIVHVRRGVDPGFSDRGVGVVEQHLNTLSKVADQESYERKVMSESAIPSVAIVAPNRELSQTEVDLAQEEFMVKYGGASRKPAILPNGTTVQVLSWSPADSELSEARKLSLLDVANMFNLDGYWLGAPVASMTYRSPGPMYLNLIRQSISPVLVDFELAWGAAWLPRGRSLIMDRKSVLQDDFQTTIQTLDQAISAGIMSKAEARVYLGLPVDVNADGVPDDQNPTDDDVLPGEDIPSSTSPTTTVGGQK